MVQIQEDMDNLNKEDKMIISEMINRFPRPFGNDQIKQWLRSMFGG
jgi:hypothetical protein